MEFFVSGITDECPTKLHRNQDKSGALRIIDSMGKEVCLAVIADGISLSFEGKYASYNTVLWLLEWAAEYFKFNSFHIERMADEIQAQMEKYNRDLNAFSEERSDTDSCTTVCGMLTDGNEILVFNAGDSRLYEINRETMQCRLLTMDNKAADGYSISMHIGGKNDGEIEVTFSRESFNPDNIYFLCTDGMYRKLNLFEWRQTMFDAQTKEEWDEIFNGMLRNIRAVGEKDDATALVIIGCDDAGE